MSKTKLTSISYHSHGNIEPIQHTSEKDSPFSSVQGKWAYLVEDLKDKTWAESPEELVSDYVRATAKMIQMEYANNACAKLNQMMAAAFMEKNINRTCFSLKTEMGQSIDLEFIVRPEGFGEKDYNKNNYKQYAQQKQNNTKANSVEFELEMDSKNIKTPDDVNNKVLEYLNSPRTERSTFNPLNDIDDRVMINLVSQVEKELSLKTKKINDLDVLVISASVLLVWNAMENSNANDFSSVISGINKGGSPLKPGYEAVIEARAKLTSELDGGFDRYGVDKKKDDRMNVQIKYETRHKTRKVGRLN